MMSKAKQRIVATRPFDESALEALCATQGLEVEVLAEGVAQDRAELRRAVRGASGLLAMISERVDDDLMAAAPELEIISNMAVGYDNVDVAAATRRGIAVCNTPGVLTETTAELALALMFAAARRVVEADRFVRAGRWRAWAPDMLLGRDLGGATLGVVGAGQIGCAVARKAQALGMTLLYSSRSPSERMEQFGASRRELDDLLAEVDVLSLHVPLTDATAGLIDARRLALMKPTAILINTARGPIVDEQALATALAAGQLFAAGLDVFATEPAVPNELLALDNVVLLPHIGSASVETRRRMAQMAADNLIRHFAGKRPASVVNGEVLSRGTPDA